MSAARIEQYRRDGVLFPIPSLPADEAALTALRGATGHYAAGDASR